MVCPCWVCHWTGNCFSCWCFDSLTSTCTSVSGIFLFQFSFFCVLLLIKCFFYDLCQVCWYLLQIFMHTNSFCSVLFSGLLVYCVYLTPYKINKYKLKSAASLVCFVGSDFCVNEIFGVLHRPLWVVNVGNGFESPAMSYFIQIYDN